MRQNTHRPIEEPDLLPLGQDRTAPDEPEIPVLLLYGREQANAAMGIGTERMPLEVAAIPYVPFPSPEELDEQFELFRRRAVLIWPLAGPDGAALAATHANRIASLGATAVGVLKPDKGHSDLPDLSGMATSRLARRRVRDCIRLSLEDAMSLALPERGDIAPRAVVAAPLSGERSRIIDDAAEFLGKYILFDNPQFSMFLALWCLHAWCVRHVSNPFDVSPRLILQGAGGSLGSARALRAISWLVPAPHVVTRASPQWLAELARRPKSTLLLEDQADTFFGFGEICAMVAAGARRDGVYLAGNPRKKGTTLPSCFAPLAIATSAMPPHIIAEQSMFMKIHQPVAGTRREPDVFGPAPDEVLLLRIRLHALADDIVAKIGSTSDETDYSIDTFRRRAWRPIFYILDAISERNAGQSGPAHDFASLQFGDDEFWLLRHVHHLSAASSSGDVSTAQILDSVNALIDRSQGPHVREQVPMHSKRLASLLERYGLRAVSIRFSDGSIARGYRGEDIAKALQNTPACNIKSGDHAPL